jgi:hypothetical protein
MYQIAPGISIFLNNLQTIETKSLLIIAQFCGNSDFVELIVVKEHYVA